TALAFEESLKCRRVRLPPRRRTVKMLSNMPRLRIFLTFGARPEAIKMAPVVRACLRRPEAIEPIVCTTGQHREMLSQAIDYFEIRPDVDLAVMRHDQSLAALM